MEPSDTTLSFLDLNKVSFLAHPTDAKIDKLIKSAIDMHETAATIMEGQRSTAQQQGDKPTQELYKAQLGELDQSMRHTLDLAHQSKAVLAQAVKSIQESISGNYLRIDITPDEVDENTIPRLSKQLPLTFESHRARFMSMPQSQRFRDNPTMLQEYKSFRGAIDLANVEGKRGPDIDTLYDDYVRDDDIEIEGDQQSYTCPLSGSDFVNPVTNVCGHTFSKQAVDQYIRKKRSLREELECPVFGCRQLLGKLEPNRQIEREMANSRKQLELQRTLVNSNLEEL